MTDRHDPEMEGLFEAMRSEWRPSATDAASFDDRLHRRIRHRRVRNTALGTTLALAAAVVLVFVVRGWQSTPAAAPGDGEPTTFAEVVTERSGAPADGTADASVSLPSGWQLAVSEEPASMDLPDEYNALSVLFLGTGMGEGS
jgi:hypothetical protein